MNDISATPLYGLPGPQAIGKEPRFCILEILWTRILTLVRLSLHSSEFLAKPRLLHLHNRAAFYSRTEQTAPLSTGTPSIDVSPVGGHSEKRMSDLTGVHIFLRCKIQVVFSETTGRKEASLD